MISVQILPAILASVMETFMSYRKPTAVPLTKPAMALLLRLSPIATLVNGRGFGIGAACANHRVQIGRASIGIVATQQRIELWT